MKALAALLLTSCSGIGVANALMPDEITLGHGKATGLTNGGYSGHNDMFEYESESNSTYAALTWDIPSFDEDALSREERHEVIERNLELAEEAEAAAGLQLRVREGVDPPPLWLPAALFGALLIGFIGFWVAGKRKQTWR